MIKRFLIVSIILIALIALASLAYSLFFISDEEPSQQAVQPKAKHWNGKEVKFVGASFVGQNNKLDILGYEFSRLNRPRANVVVVLNTRAVRGKVPAWVKAKRGFVGNIGARRVFPKVRFVSRGNLYKVTLNFSKIPVKALGISCARELPTSYGTPQYPLYVNFNSFARNKRNVLSTAVLAPNPPAGHCLGKGAKKKPQPKVNIQKIKVTGKNKNRKVWINGRATNLKKVRVSLGKKTRFPRVRNKRFKVSFAAAPVLGKRNRKAVVIRAGNNARPGLAVKRIVIRKK